MENEKEVDTQDTENTEEVTEETDVTEDNEVEPEAKAEAKPKLSDEQQLAIHRREMTKLEKKLGIHKEAPKEKPKTELSKSNEPDYAKLAYLKAEGIAHQDDRKFIMDEAERLKLPLTDVLEMKYVKEHLQANNDARVAAAGTPKGKGRTGGVGQQDVDYWLSKGETPDDQELAEKVVNARMGKEQKNKFSEELYIG